MTKTKTSTKTPREEFYTEKDIAEGKASDVHAPVVGGEFVTEEGDWRGQTVEVKSKTHLEDDKGVGEAIVLRAFQFASNPETFREYQKANGHLPYAQEIFASHMKGIMAMLWQDGLTPAEEIEPRLILSKEQDRYLILVGAKPSLGNTLLEKTQTLSEITHDSKRHTDKVSGSV